MLVRRHDVLTCVQRGTLRQLGALVHRLLRWDPLGRLRPRLLSSRQLFATFPLRR